jgi:hypothetical protein
MKYPILPILISGLLLTSCATDPGDATEKTTDQLQENKKEMNEARTDDAEEWREERTEAVKELRDLRATLEDRQMKEQKRLDDGIKDDKKRADAKAVIAEIGTNIARIDATLAKMDASTGADWSRVRTEARQATDETKSWWDRQKELIDQKTDADKDNDGH